MSPHVTLTARRAARLGLVLVAALALVLALISRGDAATTTIAVGHDGDKRIRVPAGTIKQGDTVRFEWQDNGHDLSLGGPGGESAVIDEQDEGFTFSRVLDRPGTYALVCQEHDDDGMRATFTVEPAEGGPDPSTLPPPARDVVLGGEGGSVDPTRVSVVKGASVWFHFQNGGSLTFSDGVSSGQVASRTSWRRAFADVGTYTFANGGSRGTIVVTEPVPLGIAEVPVGSATPAATIQVGSGNSYSPASVTIDEGGVVQWDWAGGPHNVQFEDGTGSPFKTSGSYAAKFYTPSDTPYTFVCTAHPGMTGSVTVRDTGAPGPDEQAPAPSEEEPGGGTDTGGGGGGTGGAPIAAEVAVGSGGDAFAPASVAVQTGDWVRWTWVSGVHNVQFDDGPGSEVISSGTWARRFLTAGTYAYRCELHPAMTGTVAVTGDPVADDGNTTVGGGGSGDGGGGGDTGGGGDDGRGVSGTGDPVARGAAASPARTAATPARPVAAGATADATRPRVGRVRTVLRRGTRRHALRLRVTEDAMFVVTMRAVGRSRDLVRKRRFRLYAREGASTLRLPAMNLTARRYRVRIVAVDRAGNRSVARKLTVRVR